MDVSETQKTLGAILRENLTSDINAHRISKVNDFLRDSVHQISASIMTGDPYPLVVIPLDLLDIGFYPGIPEIMRPIYQNGWDWFQTVLKGQDLQTTFAHDERDRFRIVPLPAPVPFVILGKGPRHHAI